VERRRTATATGSYDSFCHIFFFLHSFSLHLFVSQKSLNDEERGGNCLLVPERSYGPGGGFNQQKLYKPRTHTTEYQKSFVHQSIPQWNSLPSSVQGFIFREYSRQGTMTVHYFPWKFSRKTSTKPTIFHEHFHGKQHRLYTIFRERAT